jgi:hypothetical protein
MWAISENSKKKQSKVKDHPLSENSPNLVTLRDRRALCEERDHF